MADQLNIATVGDIVAGDFRAANVMEQFGIDFCCGGRRSLADACRLASADPAAVVTALNALPGQAVDRVDAAHWPIDRLIDHIVGTHHAYVRQALPAIAGRLATLREAHGPRHPELACIADVFDQIGAELMQHLLKEERILFPYIRELAARGHQIAETSVMPFRTIAYPIAIMEREHRDASDELGVIRGLTNGYIPPADGCSTYAVCMAEFAEFERDLHRHVHLENNVLFPRAQALENGTADD
jgi:regulator of cell morphogenesis and NO signaling